MSSSAQMKSGWTGLPSAFFFTLKITVCRSGFWRIICAMSNSGYARPVILICRARDSTPLSSGRRLRSISGSGSGGGRRSRASPRRKSGRGPPMGRPRSPSGRGAPPPGPGGPRRSPRGRLSSRRGPGGPSRRGGRGPRRSRSPRRSGRSVSPSYLAYFEAEGSCAQAGRKSLSRSNSLSGNVLITLHQALFAARLANAADAAWNGSRQIASVGWHYSLHQSSSFWDRTAHWG